MMSEKSKAPMKRKLRIVDELSLSLLLSRKSLTLNHGISEEQFSTFGSKKDFI